MWSGRRPERSTSQLVVQCSAALLCRLPNCPVGGAVVANNNLSPGKVERSLVRAAAAAAAAAAGARHAHST